MCTLANNGIFKELWLRKFTVKEKSLAKSRGESMKFVLNSKFTQYINYNSAKTKEYEDCKIKIMDFSAKKINIGFAFPKESKYLGLFNAKLQKMFESGELQKIIEKHSKESPNCNSSKGLPLGFENIAIVFCIISVGLLTSLILCAVEQILPRNKTGNSIQLYL